MHRERSCLAPHWGAPRLAWALAATLASASLRAEPSRAVPSSTDTSADCGRTPSGSATDSGKSSVGLSNPSAAGTGLCEPQHSASAVSIHVDYDVHEGCPSLESLFAQIRRRTEHAIFDLLSEPTHRYQIAIVRDKGLSRGEVQLDDSVERRHVEAGDCAAVVEALALVIAVSVEQSTAGEPPPLRDRPPIAPAQDVSSDDASPDAPTTSPSITTTGPFWVAFGLDAITTGGAAPRPLLGGCAWVEVEMKAGARPQWMHPTVRLSGGWQTTGAFDVGSSGAARFGLAHGRVEGCPLGWGDLRAAHVRACVSVDLGEVRARGLMGGQLTKVQEVADLWVAGGIGGRMGLRVAGPLFLELDVRLMVPFTRNTYLFDKPPEIVHQPWILVPSAAFGIGMRFR